MDIRGAGYDASQIRLQYQGHPGHDWHPAALLKDLSAICSPFALDLLEGVSGSFEAQIIISTAAARLGERGFDVEDVVRNVFRERSVGEHVRFSAHIAYRIERGIDTPEMLQDYGAQIRERVRAPRLNETFAAYFQDAIIPNGAVHEYQRCVAGWISRAPLERLLLLRPPTTADLEGAGVADVTGPTCRATWLVDRFLTTYVGWWHTSSLHEEFRLIESSERLDPLPELLALRSVAREVLNAEIARRAVHGEPSDPRALLSTAIEHLRKGAHEAAAALFEGALTIADSDWVRNCLAFCLVPTDPTTSVEMFEDLLAKRFSPALVHANLATIERMRGDLHAARQHAKAGLAEIGNGPGASEIAYLWGFDGEEVVLLEDVAVRDFLRLALGWG